MPQLDAGQRAVAVNRLGHHRMGANIRLVPQGGAGKGAVIGTRMNGAGAGAHHAPAALRLGFAKGGAHMRRGVGHAGGMGDLVEPVLRQFRPDADGLKQNVVARIAGHGTSIVERTYNKDGNRHPSIAVNILR
jgi:hypothetical protein